MTRACGVRVGLWGISAVLSAGVKKFYKTVVTIPDHGLATGCWSGDTVKLLEETSRDRRAQTTRRIAVDTAPAPIRSRTR